MRTLTQILLFSILLLTAGDALACKCRMISVKEDYDNSDVVISGKVISGRIITYTSDDEKRTLRRYTVQATKVYKGEKGVKTFYIYTSTSSASCGSKLLVGKKYVVYANKDGNAPVEQKKNSYWTNTCHRTKLLVQSEVDELKKVAE